MKKTMQKVLGVLLALVMLLGLLPGLTQTAYADTNVSIDMTDQGFSNQQDVTTVEAGAVTVTFDRGTGSNHPKYYTSGTAVRLYAKNTMTVSASLPISAISISFGRSDGSNSIDVNTGTLSGGSWSGSATSVTFTVGGTSGNRRISSLTVTVSAPTHTHSFTYAAGTGDQANTITASCGEGCGITEGLTLTISAPTGDLTADGTTTFPATLSTGYNATAFPEGSISAISYTKDGQPFDGTPTEAGAYTASVTVGTATASVSYTVAAPAPAGATVIWKNGDTVLKTEQVESGTQAQYRGQPPTKDDVDFSYTLSGWNDGTNTYALDAMPNVTADVTFTAVFTATAKYEAGYYIVGNMNNWKPDPEYRLTVNPGNTNEYMFSGLALTTASEFKVIYAEPNAQNPGGTRTWYPELVDNYGQNGEITANGNYNVYFSPTGVSNPDWFYNVIYVEAIPQVISFLGGSLQRRILIATDEVIDYETNMRFGFELNLPDGAVVDTNASWFKWSLYPAASATVGNQIDIKNVDTSGSKPVVNMVLTAIPKDYYSANITCFVHVEYTVGGQNYVAEEGGFARSVELVCNGLLGNDTWKDYAQSLLDAIN